ncbi:MAG TPA: hypothetical protein VN747_00945, partial [Burkholderiales bacterium]|nr:hypothetical protein [Burkholderiales bacterium]
ELVPGGSSFQPYRAAMIGMRMGAFDDDTRLKWRLEIEAATPKDNFGRTSMISDFANAALFQTTVLDRKIDAFDRVFETKTFGTLQLLFIRNPGGAGSSKQVQVSSNIASNFLSAYVAYRRSEHEKARDAWITFLKWYDDTGQPSFYGSGHATFWSATPYLAFSLAKTGKIDEAKRLPRRLSWAGRPPNSRTPIPGMLEELMPDYERKLVAGICEAFAGHHAEAQLILRGAQGAMTDNDDQLVPPEYTFVEILDALTRETGDKGYREIGLSFARGFQAAEPWTGWAYAFEAAYSANDERRVRAAALALKFDPNSAWLSTVDPQLLARAREWLSRNDPFTSRAPAEAMKSQKI